MSKNDLLILADSLVNFKFLTNSSFIHIYEFKFSFLQIIKINVVLGDFEVNFQNHFTELGKGIMKIESL